MRLPFSLTHNHVQMPAKIKAFSDLKAHVEDAKAGRLDTSAFALVDTRSLEAEIGILRAKADLVLATMKAELVDATMDVKVEPLPTGLLAMPAGDLKPSVGGSNVCDAASTRALLKEEDNSVKAEDHTSSRPDIPVKLEER